MRCKSPNNRTKLLNRSTSTDCLSRRARLLRARLHLMALFNLPTDSPAAIAKGGEEIPPLTSLLAGPLGLECLPCPLAQIPAHNLLFVASHRHPRATCPESPQSLHSGKDHQLPVAERSLVLSTHTFHRVPKSQLIILFLAPVWQKLETRRGR